MSKASLSIQEHADSRGEVCIELYSTSLKILRFQTMTQRLIISIVMAVKRWMSYTELVLSQHDCQHCLVNGTSTHYSWLHISPWFCNLWKISELIINHSIKIEWNRIAKIRISKKTHKWWKNRQIHINT